MRWSDIPWQPTRRVLRQFAGLWILFFAALAGLEWRNGAVATAALLASVAAAGVVGVLRPAAMRPIFVAWLVLVFPLSWLIFNACLALVYFGVLTPLGLLLRLAGRDPLALHPDRQRETWFEDKPSSPPGTYYRTFS